MHVKRKEILTNFSRLILGRYLNCKQHWKSEIVTASKHSVRFVNYCQKPRLPKTQGFSPTKQPL